ncbi:MAG: hypothetical protein JSV88_02395 [Candidatus Aminicenantes bacterium]|nr:MAG: hypothetical protein JSV88_02395 [Candidatus Aminicenantes bacterium]
MRKIFKKNLWILGLIIVTFFTLEAEEGCIPLIDWNAGAPGWYRLDSDGVTKKTDIWHPSKGYLGTGGLVFSPGVYTIFYDGSLGLPENNLCLLVKPEDDEVPKVHMWWLDPVEDTGCVSWCNLLSFIEVDHGTPVGDGWLLYKFPMSTFFGPTCKLPLVFGINILHDGEVIIDNLGQPGEGEIERKMRGSIHLGWAVPYSYLRNRHEYGYTLTLDLEIPITIMKNEYYLVNFLGFVNFPPSSNYSQYDWFSHYSINLKFYPFTSAPAFYFEGGPGIYYKGGEGVAWGWNAGLGIDTPLGTGSNLLEMGADFHFVYSEGKAMWLNLHLGVIIVL